MKLIEYCLVIFSIITSGSLIYMTHNDDLILILYFLFALISFLIVKIKYFNKFYFYYTLLVTSFFIFHYLNVPDSASLSKYIGTSIKIITFLLVITIIGKRNFLIIFPKVMFTLCSLNLIFYFDHVYLFSISQPISSLFSQLTTWSGNIYYENYIFYVKPVYSVTYDTVPTVIYKNSGIFGEGGHYQYFINLALIIHLFFLKKPIFSLKSIIFILSLITTYSTTGYIILFIVLITKFFNSSIKRKVIFYPVLPIVIILFFQIPTVYDKLFDFTTPEFIISTQRRIIDTYIDISIIKESPLLGIGFDNTNIYKSYADAYGGGGSSSNGLLNHITDIGLIGLFVTMYPFLMIRYRETKKIMIIMLNIISSLSGPNLMTPLFLCSLSFLKSK